MRFMIFPIYFLILSFLSTGCSVYSSFRQETTDHEMIAFGEKILTVIHYNDMNLLGKFVHPRKGVRFTPYAYVQPERDLVFSQNQVAQFSSDNTLYIWGLFDGTGYPIEMTPREYFGKFVYDRDFLSADSVSIGCTQNRGNAINNAAYIYPGSRIVEYYIKPTTQDGCEMLDWAILRLVFEKYRGTWYLVGIIHNQWTI